MDFFQLTWRWLSFFRRLNLCIGWRRLINESAGDGEKRQWLTGLTQTTPLMPGIPQTIAVALADHRRTPLTGFCSGLRFPGIPGVVCGVL